MRVLVVDASAGRAGMLRAALLLAGYEVAASISSALTLLKTTEQLDPDVVVIDTASPSSDLLDQLAMLRRHAPRPVVMFASDGSPETIRAITRAGVCAYVVDGLDESRVKSIVEVAVARFEEQQDLRGQLAQANLRLAERKLIERAKGMLMKSRQLDEQEAYAALRKAAMDRNVKLAEIAQRIVDAADLLGA
jgi:two-component system, response regulator / RNA-binding antiterminator